MEPMIPVTIKMPEAMRDQLAKIAREYFSVSFSGLMRMAVMEFLRGKRIVGVSELPGGPESDHLKYHPVPVVIVDELVEPAPDGK